MKRGWCFYVLLDKEPSCVHLSVWCYFHGSNFSNFIIHLAFQHWFLNPFFHFKNPWLKQEKRIEIQHIQYHKAIIWKNTICWTISTNTETLQNQTSSGHKYSCSKFNVCFHVVYIITFVCWFWLLPWFLDYLNCERSLPTSIHCT